MKKKRGNILKSVGFVIYPRPYWRWRIQKGRFTYSIDLGPVSMWMRKFGKMGQWHELDD